MSVSAPRRNVAILIFDDVEVLDFCGPFEVFAVTGRRDDPPPFAVFTVAERAGTVTARNGLAVVPRHTLADCPRADLLVVPGGFGTRREMHNRPLVEWIGQRVAQAELTLSVCTGALLLARAGLLDGLPATTHHAALDELRAAAPLALVDGGRRVIDNGRLVIAAGVSSGIDAAFHVVARLLGQAVAEETARYIEYPWPRAGA